MGDKDVLRAAVGGVAGELAERSFRLVHAGEDLALDHDLGAGRHFEIVDAGAGEPIGLAEQSADDLEFAHVRRIGIDHRAHVVQRMGADGDHRRQRLALLLGAAVVFEHAATRMQRDAEPVPALQHQPMEARGIDAANRIAGRNLPGGDIGGAVDRKLQRNREHVEIDIVAFDDDFVPGCFRHPLAGDVFLAALAEGRRQIA